MRWSSSICHYTLLPFHAHWVRSTAIVPGTAPPSMVDGRPKGVSVTGLDLSSRKLCGLMRSVRPNSPKSALTQVRILLELLQGTNLY
ncbi:hypothetical protein Gotur_015072, partial [Gossypium turneri]